MERKVHKRHPAFLNVILAANPNILREVREMIMTQGLFEVLEELGVTDKVRKEGEVEGERKGERKGAQWTITMIKNGYTLEQIERMLEDDALPSIDPE
jgi:glycerol dehydrogenase-like iron-containing ADH family enzyme